MIDNKRKPCPHCGGWLYLEHYNDSYGSGLEFDCVNCAAQYELGTDGELIKIRKQRKINELS